MNGTLEVLVAALNVENSTIDGTSDSLESAVGSFTFPTPLVIKLTPNALGEIKSIIGPDSRQGLAVTVQLTGVKYEGDGGNAVKLYSATGVSALAE